MRKIDKGQPAACDECGELNTHEFRSASDMVHAIQVAAGELDRGVLERIAVTDATIPEQVALRSALSVGALPDAVHYRFRCVVCGDTFELLADTQDGSGGWTRNERGAP